MLLVKGYSRLFLPRDKAGKLIRSLTLLFLLIYSGVSMGGQLGFQPTGAATSLGRVTNVHVLSSTLTNPASPYLMFDENESRDDPAGQFRFGLIGPISAGVEVGDLDSLSDELDGLEAALNDSSLTYAEALEAQAQYNAFLDSAGEEGYVKASAASYVPAFPILYQHPKLGTFAFDLMLTGHGKALVLDDDIDILVDGGDVTLETDSSIYRHTALAAVFGVGYSRRAWRHELGDLLLGAKVNLTRMKLTRGLTSIENMDEDDALEESERFSNRYSLDIGALWVSSHYLLGASVNNVNEPSYPYGEIGTNCGSKTGIEQTNCQLVSSFESLGDLASKESYVAERQLSIEASRSWSKGRWSVQASLDLNAVADATQDNYQWFAISASHFGDAFWLPGFRAGYSQNLAGTKLDYLSLGVTLFERLNLDVSWALDTVEKDDRTLPRSLFVNAGLATAF